MAVCLWCLFVGGLQQLRFIMPAEDPMQLQCHQRRSRSSSGLALPFLFLSFTLRTPSLLRSHSFPCALISLFAVTHTSLQLTTTQQVEEAQGV